MVFEFCGAGTVGDAVVKGWFRTSRDPTQGCTDVRQVRFGGGGGGRASRGSPLHARTCTHTHTHKETHKHTRAHTTPTPTQAALTALEVAGAMAYLHGHGVVHGVRGSALLAGLQAALLAGEARGITEGS